MFPLGHALLPAGAVYALQQRGHLRGLDLRVVMLGGLLPDLVDKPLTLWVVEGVRHGHWFGHSLVAALALLALGLALRDRVAWLLPLALGVLTHSLLDRLPLTEPAVWLWPALGGFPSGSWGDPVASLLASTWMLAGEVAGAAVAVWIAVRERLLVPARLLEFARSGELTPSVDEG